MLKRIATAVLITAAGLGSAASASASTPPPIGPAPVPDVKWIEWPDSHSLFGEESEAHHNTTAAALNAGYEIAPHNPRP